MVGFRRAIAAAGAITLRCNQSTNHLNEDARRRKALKFASTTKFCDFTAHGGGHQRRDIMKFSKFRLLHPTLTTKTNSPQTFFRGHRGPTPTTSTYLSTMWWADLEHDCQDAEQHVNM